MKKLTWISIVALVIVLFFASYCGRRIDTQREDLFRFRDQVLDLIGDNTRAESQATTPTAWYPYNLFEEIADGKQVKVLISSAGEFLLFENGEYTKFWFPGAFLYPPINPWQYDVNRDGETDLFDVLDVVDAVLETEY